VRIQVGILVAAALASSAALADKKPSRKDKAQAKAHLDKAAAASKDGRDADALSELDAAYALDPQPNVLFARGQLNAKLNKCDVAITELQQFVDSKPAQELADMANQGIETCKAALAPPPPPPPPVEQSKVSEQELEEDKENPTLEKVKIVPPKQTAKEAAPVAAAPAGPKHWYKDPIMLGLGVGALGTVTASVIFYVAARGFINDSESAPNYNEWRLFVDDGHRARRYSLMFGAGGAVLVGATVLYYVEKYMGKDEPAMTVTPANHGAVVGWTGRF
jgi:hypothetical protein